MNEYRPLSDRVRGWVEAVVGPIHAVERLTGGLTAEVDRLAVGGFEVVLRRWGDRRWGRELVDRDVAEYVTQLATTLARVHELDPAGLAASEPHGFDERRVDGWIRDRALAEAVKQVATEPAPSPAVVVHGDYQALNTLWLDDKLTGIVDWTYAGSGRRETDVGLCRASLAVLSSADAADTFLRRYEAEAGVRIDPAADLRALMSFGPSWRGFLATQLGAEPPNQLEEVVLRAASRLG